MWGMLWKFEKRRRPIDILGKHDRRTQDLFGGSPGFSILFAISSEKASMELNSIVYHKASKEFITARFLVYSSVL